MQLSELKEVKLEIYAPPAYVEPLREALAELGAGHFGSYDHVLSCAGAQGSWRPLPGSQPFLGQVGQLSYEDECKMEMRCPVALVREAVAVVKRLHPYEVPVYNIVPLLNSFFE